MNSKERVCLALRHETPDQVPFSLGFGVNPPAVEALARFAGVPASVADAEIRKRSDLRWVAPEYIGPKQRCRTLPGGDEIDLWGVRRRPVSYGDGAYDEICSYPLSTFEDPEQLAEYCFPSPDWFDYSTLPGRIAEAQKDAPYAIVIGNLNPFESSWYMRSLERMFEDLALRPDFAHALLERVTGYFAEYAARCLESARGGIDIFFTADDIGGQQGLLMSPSMWREFLAPCHTRLNAVVHSFGCKVMYHTDGAVMRAVDGLVGMGIDVLEALQFDAKDMDPVLLKERYGDRLCFHGGVSVQSTLPHGTPEQVRREVEQRIAVLGKNGGYILAPSHAVQAGTPPQNLLAFFEAAGRPLPFSGR